MSQISPIEVHAKMLIRRPIFEVFNAFADPRVTTKFWFNRSSGPLVQGEVVTWFWDKLSASAHVSVKAIVPMSCIEMEWPTLVRWRFQEWGSGNTFVHVSETGFVGSADEQIAHALGSTEGFNLVLCGCKAYLEHGIELGVVGDHAPPDERTDT